MSVPLRRFAVLALLLAACSAHRSSTDISPKSDSERELRARIYLSPGDAAVGKSDSEQELRARIYLARGDAAVETKQWGVAAAAYAAARATWDSPAARWGQAWAADRASTQRWTKKLEGSVLALAFAPDGEVLASAGTDSVVRVWDVKQGGLLAELQGPKAELLALAFSPDGRWLAASGQPGDLRLWDWRERRQVALLQGHSDAVRGLAFSPDGSLLASCGLDKTVRVWDVGAGTETLRFEHDAYAIAVAFSADGSQLLSTSMDRSARVWDLKTRREVHRLVGHTEKVESGAFSSDGRLIMTAAGDRTMRLWNARTGELVDVLRSQGDVSVAAIDPGFHLVVQAGWDGRVQLLDARGGELLERLDAHHAFAMSVALSPDGHTFASGGRDGVLNVWSRPAAPAEARLRGHSEWVETLAFSGKDALVTGAEDGLRTWSLSDWDAVTSRAEATEAVASLAVSPDFMRIAVGTLKGTVRVLEASSGRQLMELSGVNGSVRALAFSPDGTLLAAGGDPAIHLWSMPSGAVVGRLEGHTGKVWALAFDGTGTRLVSGGADKTVRLWDVVRRQQLRQLDAGERVRAVAFTPSNGEVVTAGMQQPIRIWSAGDGHLLRSMDEGTVGVLSVSVSPDGRFLASAGLDMVVKVWSLPSGELMGKVRRQQGFLSAVAFAPDGSVLASGASDRTVLLLRFDSVAHPPPASRESVEETLRRHGLTWDEAGFLIQYR
ncbi:WD40 repeat domain-containing protein [Pyxidicoccus parkwayensis]|uniref:WD40 repeat domain-containing protein n=1 Tax=Pyxidicoccus parkwayensis TaxID=2813578 RepID=UPI001F50E75E|nr:WD40 repeat domain-containing protein [Pyxidicoccus parkwaysis]